MEMSNNVTEQLIVDKLAQYGIKVGAINYSYSKFCKKDVVLKPGDIIEAEIYVGGKGGRYLNSYTVIGTEDTTPVALPVVPKAATTPTLPPTSVSSTKAPGGEPAVAPAVKNTKKTDSETMSKADWAAKDVAIERVAIIKSVLEGGAFAQLAVGKREEDVFQIGSRMVDFFLNKLNSLK
jgi:hypothetical protein